MMMDMLPPQYEIFDGKIYRTVEHVDGHSDLPEYEIKGYKIYRIASHRDGHDEHSQYVIR